MTGASFIETFKSKIMPVFFFFLAIYTLYTLVSSALEVSRKTLKLSDKAPSSRCVPFFDQVVDWTADNVNTSETLYDYMAGEAIVRICTDVPRENVTAALGPDRAYTPFAEQGCPLSVWRPVIGDAENFGCELVNAPAGITTCNQVLNYAPCDPACGGSIPCCEGWGWGWDVQVIANYTNASTRQTNIKCHVRLEYLNIAQCKRAWVGIFHTKSKSLEAFLWFVVAVPIVVFAAQCFMLYKFDPAPPFDDDYYVSFAMRGVPGPIYAVLWIFYFKRGKFPQAKLTLWTWLACAFQDAIEGLAAPIVAMYGCHLSRFPVPLALLVLKIIKFLVDTYLYFRDDTKNDCPEDGIKGGNDPTALPPTQAEYQIMNNANQQPQQTAYQQQYQQQQQQQQQQPMMVQNNYNGAQQTAYTSTTEV